MRRGRLQALLLLSLNLGFVDARAILAGPGGPAAPAAAAAASVARGVPKHAPKYAPNTVLVRFKAGPAAAAVAAAQARVPVVPGLQLVSLAGEHQHIQVPSGGGPAAAAAAPLPPSAIMKFQITDSSGVEAKLKQLKANPAVEHAQPEYIYYHTAQRFPNDTRFAEGDHSSGQWYLRQVWAPTAWATTVGSPAIRVCMIDTGVRRSHQDLSANIVDGWNRAVIDENGQQRQPLLGTALYRDFSDTMGHGSHTAGTVGAVGNNGVGVAGMNWKVSLFVCKAASPSGSLYESAVLDCLYLCRKEGVHVLSNSYAGGGFSEFQYEAIAKLRDAGALFVAAAGNEYTSNDDVASFPASYQLDNVVSVAAADADDTLAIFSNWGKSSVHLAAPGTMVLNTWNGNDADYEYASGTSMATPLVAGAAALLWSAKPTATFAQVKAALMQGVDKQPALLNRVISGGRLNVARSLAKLLRQANPLPPPQPATSWVVERNVGYNGSFFQGVMFSTATPEECLQLCQILPWCAVVTAFLQNETMAGRAQTESITGNCRMHDQAFAFTGVGLYPAALSAYRRGGTPVIAKPARLTAPLGSWASPIDITTTNFTSKAYTTYVQDYSPVPCVNERNRVRVFRWFSGSLPAGYANASSCPYTVGDPVLSVLSSPNRTGGPYTCVGGQDDDADVKCQNGHEFSYTFEFQPNTYYFLAVAPYGISGDSALTWFKLSLQVFPGSDPPVRQPYAGKGSWQNPIAVGNGPAGLPYLSPVLKDNSWSVKTPQPIECSPFAQDTAVIFRWFSGNVSSGTVLTATSCEHSYFDPAVVVLKSVSLNATPTTLSCVGSNDNSLVPCTGTTDTATAFTATLVVQPNTYYWFAVVPSLDLTTVRLRLRLSCQPPATGTWANPVVISAMPFASQKLCAYHQAVPPVKCAEGRNMSMVFRWFSGDQAGMATASSCGNTTGDAVVSVLFSTRPTGGFTCISGNDDDFACPSNSATVGAFGMSFQFRPYTYYWLAVAPRSEFNPSQVQLKVSIEVWPRMRVKRPSRAGRQG